MHTDVVYRSLFEHVRLPSPCSICPRFRSRSWLQIAASAIAPNTYGRRGLQAGWILLRSDARAPWHIPPCLGDGICNENGRLRVFGRALLGNPPDRIGGGTQGPAAKEEDARAMELVPA